MYALHARRGLFACYGELGVVSWCIGIGVRLCECYRARRGHSARHSVRRVVLGYIGVGCSDVRATELVESILRVVAIMMLCLGALG